MKNYSSLSGLLAFSIGVAALLPAGAMADARIQRSTHFSEVTGITAHDSTTTYYIQGNREREENLRKFTGAVLGAWQRFRGENNGALSVDIFDVGANKHFELDPKEKTYSVEAIYDPSQPEASRSNPEGEMDGADEQAHQRQQQDQDVKVTRNELTVKATGKTRKLNGFDTAEYLITWDVETENTRTGEKGRTLMTTDLWNSTDPKLIKALDEEDAYERAYRTLMHEPADQNERLIYGFGSMNVNGARLDSRQFFEKLATIKGRAVSIDAKWEVGGTDANGKPENDDQENKGSDSTLDSALGGLFGSKSQDDKEEHKSHDGMTTIFHSHIEIKSVDSGALDKSLFVVPADYKAD